MMHASARDTSTTEPTAAAALIGSSRAMAEVRQLISRFADSRLAVLIVGATGTGKDLVAQLFHAGSRRRGAFVPVNCAAIPDTLVEGELFGYRRGAFTGAVRDSPGLVAESNGGTLFLDELCSLPGQSQAKLLRVIETRQVRALGDGRWRSTDLRVVAAMQPPTDGGSSPPALREDLYHRVAGVLVRLPKLSDRIEDAFPIAAQYASTIGEELDPEVEEVLRAYSWPGNIRELRTVVERATILSGGGPVGARDLRAALRLGEGSTRGRPRGGASGTNPTREALAALVETCLGDTKRIAERMGVSRSTVYRRLNALGLSVRSLRWTAESASGEAEAAANSRGFSPGRVEPRFAVQGIRRQDTDFG